MDSKNKKILRIEYKKINYWIKILEDKKKQIYLLSSIINNFSELKKEKSQLIKSMIKNNEKIKEYSKEPSNLFKYVAFIINTLNSKIGNESNYVNQANKEIQNKINRINEEIEYNNLLTLSPSKLNEIDKIKEILSSKQNSSKNEIEKLTQIYNKKLEEKENEIKNIIENLILKIFKGHVYLNQLLFFFSKSLFDAYNNIKNYINEKKDEIFGLTININDHNERRFYQSHGIYFEPIHFNDNISLDNNINISNLCNSFYYYMKSFIQNIKIRKKILNYLMTFLKIINENQNNTLQLCINKINDYLNENNVKSKISRKTWNLFLLILQTINSFQKNLENNIPIDGFKNEENIIEIQTKINLNQFEKNWIKKGEKIKSLKNEYEKISDKNLKNEKEEEIKKYINKECIPLLKENIFKIRESQKSFCLKATSTFDKYSTLILDYINDCINNTKNEIENIIEEDLFDEINYFIEKYYEEYENEYSEEYIYNQIQKIQLQLLTNVQFEKDNFNQTTLDSISNYFSNIHLSRIESLNIDNEKSMNLSNNSFEEEIPIELSNVKSNKEENINKSIKLKNNIILNTEKSIDMTEVQNFNINENNNKENEIKKENYIKKTIPPTLIDEETFKRQFENRNKFINHILKKMNFFSNLNSITSKRMNIFEKEYSNDPIFFLREKEFDYCIINEKDLGIEGPLTIIFHYIFSPYTMIKQFPQKKSFFENIYIQRGDINVNINYEQYQKELIPIYFDDLDYVANLFYNIEEEELEDFLSEIENWNKKIKFELTFVHPMKKLMIGPDRITMKDIITIYFISPTDLIIENHSYGSDFPFSDTFVSIIQYRFHCDFNFNIQKGYFEFKTSIKLLHTVKILKKLYLESALKIEAFKKNKIEINNHVFNPLVLVVKDESKNFCEMAIKLFQENLRRNLHKFNQLSQEILDEEKKDNLKIIQNNNIEKFQVINNLNNNFSYNKNNNFKDDDSNMTFYSMFGIIFVLFFKILMEQNSFFDCVLSFIIIFLLIYFFYQINQEKK